MYRHLPQVHPHRRWDTKCATAREQNMHLNLAMHSLELIWMQSGMYELVKKIMPIWATALFDADHMNPYTCNCMWISHFWDPRTDLNYKGQKWPTAKTSIDEFWTASTENPTEEQSSI